MMLDPVAAGMMQMIGHWPNINEDDMRAEAGATRNAAAAQLASATQAETTVRGAQQNYRGGSAEAMQTQWNRLGVNGGSLAQASQALNVAPAGLEGAASVVSAVKVVSGMQAAATAVSVAKLLAFGGAAGASLAVARMRLAQTQLRKAQAEGMEITGKRLGEVIVKKVTGPMRRILDDLPRRGSPGGRLALAGPRGGMPVRPAGMRASSGPRSAENGIARMSPRRSGNGRRGGWRRNRGGNGGNGGRGYEVTNDGRIHGNPPTSARGMSKAEADRTRREIERSINTREKELDRLGSEVGHEEKLKREKDALRQFKESMQRREYHQDHGSSPSAGGGQDLSDFEKSMGRKPYWNGEYWE
ncbi:hypothetical protein ACFFSA_26420 [Nonomuraea helvata]|uniref:Outer membrane channel protein CpnT-like N-terminal domain-containing protein n=2 Tax=Nonomuraea helvata TaxID=37484 RepID=A0ABV5S4N7_9ACTN